MAAGQSPKVPVLPDSGGSRRRTAERVRDSILFPARHPVARHRLAGECRSARTGGPGAGRSGHFRGGAPAGQFASVRSAQRDYRNPARRSHAGAEAHQVHGDDGSDSRPAFPGPAGGNICAVLAAFAGYRLRLRTACRGGLPGPGRQLHRRTCCTNWGSSALIAARPAEYDRLVHRSREEGRDLRELELACFGLDHREMGLRLVDAWKLPREFRAFIKCHGRHVPPRSAGGNRRAGWRICSASGWPARRRNSTARGFPVSRPALWLLRRTWKSCLALVAIKINTLECSLVMV